MDKKTAIKNARKYANRVKAEFSPESIVMFGSYVNGDPHEWSDLDIAVIFNGFNGEWLETSARLWRLSYDIDNTIEPHLLDRTQDKTGFVAEILKTGRMVG